APGARRAGGERGASRPRLAAGARPPDHGPLRGQRDGERPRDGGLLVLRRTAMTHPAHWKLELTVRGARLDPTAARLAAGDAARPLELVLPGDVRVDVPIDAGHTAGSPFALLADGSRHFLVRRDSGGAESARLEVRRIARPAFYVRRTGRRTPVRRVATVGASHLPLHPRTTCACSVRAAPSRFCVQGARVRGEDEAVL